MKRGELKNYFSTFDLALATAISLWFPLESVDKSQDSHRVLFLFRNSKQLSELIETYWRGGLKVNPQEYFNALKNMKARLYSNE